METNLNLMPKTHLNFNTNTIDDWQEGNDIYQLD